MDTITSSQPFEDMYIGNGHCVRYAQTPRRHRDWSCVGLRESPWTLLLLHGLFRHFKQPHSFVIVLVAHYKMEIDQSCTRCSPATLCVLSYRISMSYALENQRDWRTSHNWVLDRLDVVPADGAEFKIIDKVLGVLESLPCDAPLKGFGTEINLRTAGLRSLLASCPIDGRVLDTLRSATKRGCSFHALDYESRVLCELTEQPVASRTMHCLERKHICFAASST